MAYKKPGGIKGSKLNTWWKLRVIIKKTNQMRVRKEQGKICGKKWREQRETKEQKIRNNMGSRKLTGGRIGQSSINKCKYISH